ncbi:MAG: hypothetical protein ACOCPM_01465 [Bacteroidales bacterium]
MIGIKRYIILVALLFCGLGLFSQEQEEGTGDELLRHEWNAGGLLHIDGFGITGRNIKSITYYRKWFYEADIITMKHPKEVRTTNSYYPNTKSFIYGKKNSFTITRFGVGMQRLLNREPFWGEGLEVRMIYSVGTSLGFTKPVYLYIITDQPGFSSNMSYKLEKYKPDKHGIWDIQGRGPITKGFDELGFYPGAYGKFGFNFEFAQERSKIRALEAGAVLDLYPDKIPIMAKNKNKQLFLSFYISFYFGGRYN